jgi:tetratricopeptide (TPR) repeat protein
MKKYGILFLSLACLTTAFTQVRNIQENQIKAIEVRMVDFKSSVFLADSLYQDYLTNGSFEMQLEKYPKQYQSGSSLLYNYYDKLVQKYPDKCKECRTRADLLLVEMNREVQEAGEIEYKKVVAKADGYFTQRNYQSAKEYYQRALTFRASDPYPKTKLLEIERLLFEKRNEQEFNSEIFAGDSLFAARDFENAKKHYTKALMIKISDDYPAVRIAEIDSILEEQKKSNK